MKSSLLAALLAILSPALWASEALVPFEAAVDLGDAHALQRGARMYANYCQGCHSLQYMRYSRAAEDMALPEDVLRANLMFNASKPSEPILSSMRAEDAERWFGVVPPDLSVTARSRGPDWILSYLLTYYVDPARPTGVNNLTYPATAMPHVLADLQGVQRHSHGDDHGHAEAASHGGGGAEAVGLELVTPGTMNPAEYRAAVNDLVSFLTYVSEPAKRERQAMGMWVIAFLLVLCAMTYALKKEFWRDVH